MPRCAICNSVNDQKLVDETSPYTPGKFFVDPTNTKEGVEDLLCTRCHTSIYGSGDEERILENLAIQLGLDEQTEQEVNAYLRELDKKDDRNGFGVEDDWDDED